MGTTSKAAVRATAIKKRCVNIRLSSSDLTSGEGAGGGVPYQTLIASVLHKYVSGRLTEKQRRITRRSSGRVKARR
jgi:predicted DNA binding CopG/RHH family protein